MRFQDYGVIRYPEYIDTVSIYIGKLRDLLNSEMNEEFTEYKRGDRSEYVNILGVKGELIVQNFLFQKKVKFTSTKLIDVKPVIGADVFIGKDIKIDVKTIRDDAPDLLVNEKAHLKIKDVTHYWFIQPLRNGFCNYWIYKYEDVNNWDVKNVKYSNAYYMNIQKLINEKTNSGSVQFASV